MYECLAGYISEPDYFHGKNQLAVPAQVANVSYRTSKIVTRNSIVYSSIGYVKTDKFIASEWTQILPWAPNTNYISNTNPD